MIAYRWVVSRRLRNTLQPDTHNPPPDSQAAWPDPIHQTLKHDISQIRFGDRSASLFPVKDPRKISRFLDAIDFVQMALMVGRAIGSIIRFLLESLGNLLLMLG